MQLFINLEQYISEYKTKQLALFHAIRDAILTGKLRSHDQLPPTRTLAKQLTLSRGTVNNVYEMLLAQGYLYSKVGSGVFVNEYELTLKDKPLSHTLPILSKWGQHVLSNQHLSTYKNHQTSMLNNTQSEQLSHISFAINKVNFDDFPLTEWNKVMFEHTRNQYAEDEMLNTPPEGNVSLREAIKKQLYVHRGINVDSKQIVIVNGSLQALALLSHLLVDEGDHVAFENPHYSGMRTSVEVLGGKIDSYPVDDHGIIFNPTEKNYKLLYLTPNRQFPTGAVLSMERRLALIQWAYEHRCFIIEDDYDSEFSYTNRAIEPLKALDLADQVVYIGSFSRTMMQHIRIGYAVLPKQLVEPFVRAKMLFERLPTAVIQQRALASFMELGYYDRHQRRLRRIYREKAYFFQDQLFSKTSHFLKVRSVKAGLHIFIEWISTAELYPLFLDECELLNVKVVNSEYMYHHSPKPSFCLGFAHLNLEEIEEGVNRLVLAYTNVASSLSQ